MTRSSTIISVVSPKGGVGKTTVVASLAMALFDLGRPVMVVDFDPQNALRLHFRMPFADARGLALQALRQAPVVDSVFESPFGVRVLPYGLLAESDRVRFEALLQADPAWLRRSLEPLFNAPGMVMLIDTAPGASVYMQQALSAADLSLQVLLPDAASFVTVSGVERWLDQYARPRPGFVGSYYLVNRMNASRPLCRDVLSALQRELDSRLAPHALRFDALIEEALASQCPVLRYAPESVGARDAGTLASWLSEQV